MEPRVEIVKDDTEEFVAVAHLRGWCHDCRECPICKAYAARQEVATTLLTDLEQRYVEALSAVLAAPVDRESDHDVDRWRGHAEAYRTTCERIRRDAGLPPAKYRSGTWRREHGVYEPDRAGA